MAEDRSLQVDWSTDVEQTRWIADRLRSCGAGLVGSVIPDGFPRYARMLHPARGVPGGPSWIRWKEVAAATGAPLVSDQRFISLALAADTGAMRRPWSSGPVTGALTPEDAEALVAVLADYTTSPDDCWFCLWDGYGWESESQSAPGASALVGAVADVVPLKIWIGPKAVLAGRHYFLYRGAIRNSLALFPYGEQTPNLWWPSDRSWCVASDIDLESTYIGGSPALVDRLLSSPPIEAVRCKIGDVVIGALPAPYPKWLDEMTASVLRRGTAQLSTPYGGLSATLALEGARATLTIARDSPSGDTRGTSTTVVGRDNQVAVRRHLEQALEALVLR